MKFTKIISFENGIAFLPMKEEDEEYKTAKYLYDNGYFIEADKYIESKKIEFPQTYYDAVHKLYESGVIRTYDDNGECKFLPLDKTYVISLDDVNSELFDGVVISKGNDDKIVIPDAIKKEMKNRTGTFTARCVLSDCVLDNVDLPAIEVCEIKEDNVLKSSCPIYGSLTAIDYPSGEKIINISGYNGEKFSMILPESFKGREIILKYYRNRNPEKLVQQYVTSDETDLFGDIDL